MTATCLICHRREPTGGPYACPVCADELRGWLNELPQQARLLEEFVAPAGRPARGRLGGTGRAHAPMPVDIRVLALLGPGHPGPVGDPDDDTDTTVPIHVFLAGWAGHIAYTYPATTRDPYGTAHTRPCEQAWPSQGATITGWCAWLTAYLPYTLTQQLIGELHRQLGDLLHRIRDLTHAVPHSQEMAASCPKCDHFALARTDGRWRIHCSNCGHSMDPLAYDEHAAAFLQTHQTTSRGTAA